MTPTRKPARAIAVALAAFALLLVGPPALANAGTPSLTIAHLPQTSNQMPTLKGTTTEPGNPIKLTILTDAHPAVEVETIEVSAMEIAMEAWSATLKTPLEPGQYTAIAEQEQEMTNVTSEAVIFTIDAKPAVTINAVFSRTADPTPMLTGTAGLGVGDLKTVAVSIYKGESATGTPELSEVVAVSETGQWSYTSPHLAYGTYTARVSQSNEAEPTPETESATVTFTVDAPPAVSITVPTPSEDSSAELSGTAGVGVGDLKTVAVSIYKGKTAKGTPVATAPEVAVNGAGQWSYTSPLLVDGTYTANVSQSNEAEPTPQTQSKTVTFTIDRKPPVIVISTPEDEQLLSVASPTFSGTSDEAGGDLHAVTLNIYAGASASGTPLDTLQLTAAEWTAGVAGPALENGIYTAVAEQADDAGNVGTTSATFVVVVPPAASTTPPAPTPASPPTAAFQWFPAHPITGETVSLVSISTDTASPIAGFAWALTASEPFAAGTPVLKLSFPKPGSYAIRLRVTNTAGLSSTATGTILVSAPPVTVMQPFPVVRILGSDNSRGTKIALLTVAAPLGATVKVKCRGPGCPSSGVSVRTVSHVGSDRTGVIAFPRYQRLLRAGAALEISVAKAGEIGKYTRFSVRRGKLPTRVDECLSAAGTSPIVCPT